MEKAAGKSNEFEPTLMDVLEAVQTGFTKMEKRFDGVDERLDKVETRLGEVEGRMTAVEKRTGNLETAIEDMSKTLEGVERAVDTDAVTIVDHGRRIVHLEKICAVPT